MNEKARIKQALSEGKPLAPIQRISKVFEDNQMAWGMYFLPHHFRSESPPFHLKILKEANAHRYLAIQAPRESAKSTILNLLNTTHAIAHQKKRFVVIVQNTYSKAAGSLESIKMEFKNNQKIKETYGIVCSKDREGDSIFTHPNGFQTRILCKGAEQIGSVRGEKFGAYRPDLILGDDMEDDEMVRNPDRRRTFSDEFNEALIPAGDRELCQYIFIGTILHDDCTMAKLVSPNHYPEYRKLFYKARYKGKVSGEIKSLWAEKWTVEDLNELERKKPSVFAKEYQGDPASGMRGNIKKDDFRRWTIENMNYILFDDQGKIIRKGDLSECKAAISCDLAWDEKRENDFSVIMPGYLTPYSDLLVENYVCKKGMRPHEIEEILFSMEDRLRSITGKTVPIGFEKAKLEKVMKWLLKQAMQRRNKYLSFRDLLWDADKITRIITRLEPRYAQNSIFHKGNMGDLEHQIIRLPDGAHDDLPDALQGLVQLLQYTPTQKKEKSQDTEFDWWRQQAINARTKPRYKNQWGKKKKAFGIPAQTSYK